ncbi:hypothetical protein [Pedobacter sp. UBA5917]|jgi:hypothetical protein|uniref:hypothetical protein n=1 Tax=Pedobacter sp. UBA5917 TaxID=1947061 RepID=UPI0025E2804C|nr:hypothetical protein [Pedobacter sp. UBA5917]
MNTSLYLKEFQKAADQLDKGLLSEKQIEVAVGVVLDSVCLKLYKKSWASGLQDPLTAESRIFFSIWVNDATVEVQKISYNIHAFKLRYLKGYAIQSRQFADVFRESFKAFEHQWPNVSVNYGPLTLMEGWIKLVENNLPREVLSLANNFLAIEHLVDDALLKFKK